VVLLSGSGAASDTDNAISRYQLASECDVRASGLDWTILPSCGFMSTALRWILELRVGEGVPRAVRRCGQRRLDPYDIAGRGGRAYFERALGMDRSAQRSGVVAAGRAGQVLGERLGRDRRLDSLSNDDARAEMLATTLAWHVDALFSFYVDGTLDGSRVLPTVQDVAGVAPNSSTGGPTRTPTRVDSPAVRDGSNRAGWAALPSAAVLQRLGGALQIARRAPLGGRPQEPCQLPAVGQLDGPAIADLSDRHS
jgi:hypothetical protein